MLDMFDEEYYLYKKLQILMQWIIALRTTNFNASPPLKW